MKGSKMKKALVIMLLAVMASCTSCAHLPFRHRTVSRADVPNSVFQIRSDIEVNPDPVCDGEVDADANSTKDECVAKLHENIGGKTFHFRFIGTAWVAGHSHGHSQVITAGHMCETRPTYPYERWNLVFKDGHLDVEVSVTELPIVSTTYDLVAPDGTKIHDLKVQRDDDEGDGCLMTAAGDIGPALPISNDDPEYGGRCYYVGAPLDIWGNGLALTVDLTYSGRSARHGLPEMLIFSGPSEGGASGSPVICDGAVVGILDRSMKSRFPLTIAADYDVIRGLFEKKRSKDD